MQEQGQGQQIMAQVMQALQQGIPPQELMAKLVESGMPEEQAGQLIQMAMQQGGGGQQQGPPQGAPQGPPQQQGPPQGPPQMRYGGRDSRAMFQVSGETEDEAAATDIYEGLMDAEIDQPVVDDYYNTKAQNKYNTIEERKAGRKAKRAENRANFDYAGMGTGMLTGSSLATQGIAKAVQKDSPGPGSAQNAGARLANAAATNAQYGPVGMGVATAAEAASQLIEAPKLAMAQNREQAGKNIGTTGTELGDPNALAAHGLRTAGQHEALAIAEAAKRANNPGYIGRNNSNLAPLSSRVRRAGYYPMTRAPYAYGGRPMYQNSDATKPVRFRGEPQQDFFKRQQAYYASKRANLPQPTGQGFTIDNVTGDTIMNSTPPPPTTQTAGQKFLDPNYQGRKEVIRTNKSIYRNPDPGSGKSWNQNPVGPDGRPIFMPTSQLHPNPKAYGGRNFYAYGGGYYGKKY